MANESMDERPYGSQRTTTRERVMHGEMKKKGKGMKMPVPQALIIMFGDPYEKGMGKKKKKRMEEDDYDEEEYEGKKKR